MPIGERLSLRKAKKELEDIEGSHVDDEILREMTPEGRSLVVRVMQDVALNGLAIQISHKSRRTD